MNANVLLRSLRETFALTEAARQILLDIEASEGQPQLGWTVTVPAPRPESRSAFPNSLDALYSANLAPRRMVAAVLRDEELPSLAHELGLLRAEMRTKGCEADHDQVIGLVASAEKAALAGQSLVVEHYLRQAGSWAINVAASSRLSTALNALLSVQASASSDELEREQTVEGNPRQRHRRKVHDKVSAAPIPESPPQLVSRKERSRGDMVPSDSASDTAPDLLGRSHSSVNKNAWDFIRDEVYQLLCTKSAKFDAERKQLEAGKLAAVSVLGGVLVSRYGLEVGMAANIAALALAVPLRIGVEAWGKAYLDRRKGPQAFLEAEKTAIRQILGRADTAAPTRWKT